MKRRPVAVEFPTQRSVITTLRLVEDDYWDRVSCYRKAEWRGDVEAAGRLAAHVQAAADAINALSDGLKRRSLDSETTS